MSDPGTSYRSRDEVQEVRQTRDPITQFKDKIINAQLTTADELKKIDAAIKTEIDAATKHAKGDKEIGMAELFTDVYAQDLTPLIRGITHFNLHPHATLNKRRNK